MKLEFDVANKSQPDPFIFEDMGKFYLYVTGRNGVEAYSAEDIFGAWHYEGVVASAEGAESFWAPSVIKIDGVYYIYVSFVKNGEFEFMHVASSGSPLGPFGNWKKLYDCFSIDSHTVMTENGLFIWLAMDVTEGDKIGTRVFVDRLLDPTTPENKPKEVISPDFPEEIFMRNRFGDGRDWYTIEGPFWFREGDWQYVMYSGGCYENDSYHIGYAAARTDETDLTKIDFVKHTNGGEFSPVMLKNEYEEGTGHHSVIKHNGEYYAVYHARDYSSDANGGDRRTARICRLTVDNGRITAQRRENGI